MRSSVVVLAMAVALGLSGADSSPAAASVRKAADAWHAGDYKTAYLYWLPAAARGDANALFGLGHAYYFGRGVEKDMDRAENFYRRAASRGHARAKYMVGLLLMRRGEGEAAAAMWKESAAAGHPQSRYMLGAMHFNGGVVEKNWPLAYAYMLAANNQGERRAVRALGTMRATIPTATRAKGEELAQKMMADRGRLFGDMHAEADAADADAEADAARAQAHASAEGAPAQADAAGAEARPDTGRALAEAEDTPESQSADAGEEAESPAISGRHYRVQIAAHPNRELAEADWQATRTGKAAELFGGAVQRYEKADDVVRIHIGEFARFSEAAALCERYKRTGRDCFVVARD